MYVKFDKISDSDILIGVLYLLINSNIILRSIIIQLKFVLTRRGSNLRETDFSGHWRVNSWYLKMKPSADNFIQWALFLEISSI